MEKHRTLAMEVMLLRGELKCVTAERSVTFTATKANLLGPIRIQEDLNNAQSGIPAAMAQLWSAFSLQGNQDRTQKYWTVEVSEVARIGSCLQARGAHLSAHRVGSRHFSLPKSKAGALASWSFVKSVVNRASLPTLI